MKNLFNKKQVVLAHRNIDVYQHYYDDELRPAIIFMHDAMGVSDYIFSAAHRLAQLKLQVFVPDLYSHTSAASYCLPFLLNAAVRNNEKNGNEKLDEIGELISYVKNQKLVDADRLGFIGQCLTGGFVLHTALLPEVKAPVVFHHSFGLSGCGISNELAAQIDKPVQGHFSKFDPMCPSARVDRLQKIVGDNLIRYEYNLPHGIPHFFEKSDEGALAFSRIESFFRTQLGV